MIRLQDRQFDPDIRSELFDVQYRITSQAIGRHGQLAIILLDIATVSRGYGSEYGTPAFRRGFLLDPRQHDFTGVAASDRGQQNRSNQPQKRATSHHPRVPGTDFVTPCQRSTAQAVRVNAPPGRRLWHFFRCLLLLRGRG
jgi:hypothetical protein